MLTWLSCVSKRDLGKGENTIGMLATSYNFIENITISPESMGGSSSTRQTTFTFQVLGTTSRNLFFDQSHEKERLSHRKRFRLLG